MNFELVEKIANVVLYEGYLLYPYRPSSIKNRQRFNFGVLAPEAYCLAEGGAEAWRMQTECLLRGDRQTRLDVKVRFLHLVRRGEIGGRDDHPWQEAVERTIDAPDCDLGDLVARPRRLMLFLPPRREEEPRRDAGEPLVVRTQQGVEGALEIAAERVTDEWYRVTARVLNLTQYQPAAGAGRDEALLRSLVSTHTILGARGGEFASLLDPPAELRAAASACENLGAWPVLVGREGERDLMLSSPIILYDYPEIAPESAGDLFDGTEIDEILALRIMTLTEAEKREVREGDERARQMLERIETLPAEQLMKLHGALRRLRPAAE